MKKKPLSNPQASAPAHGVGPLIEQVRDLVQSARRAALANVNTLQVLTNFEIGRLIVEHVQQGEHRAAYGRETLKHLAASLTAPTHSGKSATPFTLSWSHYVFLLGIRDENERRFYEIESAQGSWSLPELRRQLNSGLYERLALSGDKKRVAITGLDNDDERSAGLSGRPNVSDAVTSWERFIAREGEVILDPWDY